jgi:alanine dehydrogenase
MRISLSGSAHSGRKNTGVDQEEDAPHDERGVCNYDISIDQGGCIETSRPTTHDDPTFEVDGNYSLLCREHAGAYPGLQLSHLRTQHCPYIHRIAREGIEKKISEDTIIRSALEYLQRGNCEQSTCRCRWVLQNL